MLSRLVVALVVVAATAAPGIATAQDGLEQCFGKEISQREAQMDCVKMPGGEWTPVGGGETGMPGRGAFFVFAIFLALIPAFAGMALAPDANVSPVAGFGSGCSRAGSV